MLMTVGFATRLFTIAQVFTLIIMCSTWARADEDDVAAQKRREAAGAARRGEYEEAVQLATEAIAAAPDAAAGYATRADSFEQLRRFEQADADWSAALEREPQSAALYDRRGGVRFKLGQIDKSLEDFDRAIELEPQRAESHWRRGISLYYAGRFDEGAAQFELGKKVYANDVENAFWHFLCIARHRDLDSARAELLEVGFDRRVPLMVVYALLQGDAEPDDVLAAANKAADDETKDVQLFYGHLYLALYNDALGQKDAVREHLQATVNDYAHPGNYMWEVARVHWERLTQDGPNAASE